MENQYDVELFHRHGRGVRLKDTELQMFAIIQGMYVNPQEAIEFYRESRD